MLEEVNVLNDDDIKNINRRILRIHNKKSLNWIIKSIQCGKHSDIPLCCNIFWHIFWAPIYEIPYLFGEKLYKKLSSIRLKIVFNYHKKIGRAKYVVCPICVLNNNIIFVKSCNCYH